MTPGGDDEQQISRMAFAVGSRLFGMPPPHTYEEAWQVEQHSALSSARRLASVNVTGGLLRKQAGHRWRRRADGAQLSHAGRR
jgi:hypothetical protein